MENYQRALTYETIVRVLQKADGYCWDQFLQVTNECDTREELPYNINTYSSVLGISRQVLSDAYLRCRQAFEHLDDRTKIIDQTSPLWPDDVTGVPFLYLQGDVNLLQEKGISVVGTRNPSNRGMALAREVVDSLGESGFTIVSGLAMGIDGVAHIEALAKDFKTIGVIGTSVCESYPPKHERLQSLIAEHGLLVSQFAPSRRVQQYFFMQRNLLMSQISMGSFVIESKDGGGGVKQAQYSEKQGKKVFILREVYDNRTYLWPRRFNDPVIISLSHNSGTLVKRALQMTRTFGRKKKDDLQPSLF
ncbi:MAG: DNA-processing protein DprA [Spirochaetales bacterium]|nr:DNA-processing protein DprA [Spirochaetales bacterium]